MPRALVLPILLAATTLMRAEVTPGEILMSEMNCAACHDAGPQTERLASRQSPRLGTDGVRVPALWLREFLADPQKAEPGTLMPHLLHSLAPEQKAEAVEALTHFLVSLQAPAASAPRVATTASVDEGGRLYHSVGCVMCHAPFELPAAKANDPVAKDELARLVQTSVPLGASLAGKYTFSELARFLRDPLKARPSGRMPDMNLTDREAEAVAAYLLRQQTPSDAPFIVDAAKAARGKQVFAEMNCAACHAGTDAPKRAAKPLSQLSARQPRGCLGSRPGANVPKFEITDRQRQVILALLQEQTPLNLPLDAEHQIRRTLTTLNCYACHARDRRGGPDGLRRDYCASTSAGSSSDDDRIPPSLTRVGARLRLEQIKQSLLDGTKTRPQMATRMPRVGAANAGHLPALFEQADGGVEKAPR